MRIKFYTGVLLAMMAAQVQPVNISTHTELSEAPDYEAGNMMAQSLSETEAGTDVYADAHADADAEFKFFSKVKSFFSRGKKKKEEEARRKRNEANRRAARK